MGAGISKRLILVIGMHRSGTSAITRGLQALGVDLGESLLEPGPSENPLGFWEDRDVVELNQRLLIALGCDWDRTAEINQRALSDEDLEDFVTQATELLSAKLADRSVWAFKDPRTSRLLWFWKCVFARLHISDVSYVLCLRNPLSVSDSLFARNAMDRAVSILLWGVYMVDALQHVDPSRTVVIDYDRIMEHGRDELRQVAEAIHLPLPDGGGERAYLDDFLSPSLRHSKYGIDQLRDSGLAHHTIVSLYTRLKEVAEGRLQIEANAMFEALEDATQWLQGLSMVRETLDRVHCAYHGELARSQADAASQHEAIERIVCLAEFEDIRSRAEMFRLEGDRLRERNGELEGRLSQFENISDQAEMFRLECDRLRARNGELDGHLGELDSVRAQTEMFRLECDRLRARNGELDGHLSELESVRAQMEMFRLECDRLRERNGELKGQLSEKEDVLLLCRSQLDEFQVENHSLRERNRVLLGQMESAKTLESEVREEADRLRGRCAALVTQVDLHMASIDERKTRETELCRLAEQLANELSDVRLLTASLSAQKSDLQEHNAMLSSRIVQLRASRALLADHANNRYADELARIEAALARVEQHWGDSQLKSLPKVPWWRRRD